MNRFSRLFVLGGSLALVASPCLGAAKGPWRIFNLDCDHFQGHGRPKSLMTREAIEQEADEYLQGHVTHLFVNPQSMRACYPSKVLETRWAVLGDPDFDVSDEMRLCIENVKFLVDRGIDIYDVYLRRARAKGAEGWISMRMNDLHGVDDVRNPMVSKFWRDNRNFWRYPGTEAKSWSYRAFDYAHKEVRDLHVRAACELLERYDMEGFDVDWTRFPWHLTPSRERELAGCLTEVMRRIRAKANEMAARRKHPIRVAATVLSSPEASESMGMDAVGWAKEGLVDVILAANFFGSVDFNTPYRDWCAKVHAVNPNVRIVARLDNGVVHDGGSKRMLITAEEYCGYFERLLAQGCRDFAFFNLFALPGMGGYKTESWKVIVEDGFTHKSVLSHARSYPASFRDVVMPDVSNLWQFPFEPDGKRAVKIEIGKAANVGQVFVEAGFDGRPSDGKLLTLNGARALSGDPEWKGEWLNGGTVKNILRCEFPARALKDGVNVIGYPALEGLKATGCVLHVIPK